jgi:hypothetical protein
MPAGCPPVGNLHFNNVTVVDVAQPLPGGVMVAAGVARPFLSLLTPAQPIRGGGLSTPNRTLVQRLRGRFTVTEGAGQQCTPALGPNAAQRGVDVQVTCTHQHHHQSAPTSLSSRSNERDPKNVTLKHDDVASPIDEIRKDDGSEASSFTSSWSLAVADGMDQVGRRWSPSPAGIIYMN